MCPGESVSSETFPQCPSHSQQYKKRRNCSTFLVYTICLYCTICMVCLTVCDYSPEVFVGLNMHRYIVGISTADVRYPSKLWQCDSEHNTRPVKLKHHSSHYLHLCFCYCVKISCVKNANWGAHRKEFGESAPMSHMGGLISHWCNAPETHQESSGGSAVCDPAGLNCGIASVGLCNNLGLFHPPFTHKIKAELSTSREEWAGQSQIRPTSQTSLQPRRRTCAFSMEDLLSRRSTGVNNNIKYG